MKVGEIREHVPEANVYELRDDAKYLIVIEPGHRREIIDKLCMLASDVSVLEHPEPREAVKILVGEGVHDVNTLI